MNDLKEKLEDRFAIICNTEPYNVYLLKFGYELPYLHGEFEIDVTPEINGYILTHVCYAKTAWGTEQFGSKRYVLETELEVIETLEAIFNKYYKISDLLFIMFRD